MAKYKLNALAQAMKKVATTTVMQNAELAEAIAAELESLRQDEINPLREFVGVPDAGTHEYVDLGLPSGLLWAKFNVGAEKESDYGLYFAWGETDGYADASGEKKFTWGDYKFGEYIGNEYPNNGITKYNVTDRKVILDPEDDAAHIHMGGSWRMPTSSEFLELFHHTYSEIALLNGVRGRKYMRPDNHDVYIFFPFAGSYKEGQINLNTSYFWCSDKPQNSSSYYSTSYGRNPDFRYIGKPVRGVISNNRPSLYTSKADKVRNAKEGRFPVLDAAGNLIDSGKRPGDFYEKREKLEEKFYKKKKDILVEEDGIYQIKDNSVYPVAHPDLSTQPSILSQRFGNLDICEVLIANGREDEIPINAMVIEAWSFNSAECIAAVCRKDENGWHITNPENIVPDFTLVKYVGHDSGYYYEYLAKKSKNT